MSEDLGLGVVVSMKDAFSQNAGRVEGSMRSLDSTVATSAERMTRNMDRIQKGAMMMGAGLAMMALPLGLVASTAATQKALGELASLGVKDLRAIEDAAESFTNTWAGSGKADFITAAYDVRSALSGLTDEAVGSFTAMAALTGKATKATTEEMVGTFTTAYGIFKPIMAELSDAEWARTFAGAMAQTVASFKTNGRQMADAIKNIGAVAAANNVPLQEQLAILGQLQITMPGSEAGTLYKAFIMKAAEAGEKLGLELVGSSGQLKGIIPILQEIQDRFPDLSQAAAQVEIKKAFGSDEAVKFLLQMSQGVAALETNIQSVERAMRTGTAVTQEMARTMNLDVGARLKLVGQQMGNLAEILGRTLLPVVTPVLDAIGRVILFFQDLARSSPGLTRVLLSLSLAIGAVLTVVGGVLVAAGTIGLLLPAIKVGLAAIGAVLGGLGAALATYFLPIVAIIGGIVLAVFLLKKAWDTNFGGIRDTILGVWNKIKLVFSGIRALISSLTGGIGQMPAELAEKLEQAGLMGLVVTLFRIYYRVRQFLAGLWNAFSSVFGQVREILEPPVRALMEAFGRLFQAIGSLVGIFGVASNSADASAYQTLGSALGTVLGVIVKIIAFLLKTVIYGLVGVIETIAWVVRAFATLGKAVVTAAIKAGQFLYRFYLPFRMLIEGLRLAVRIAITLWRVLSGEMSLIDGLRTIGRAVMDYLTAPFRWARDVVTSVWDFVSGLFGSFGRFVSSAAASVVGALRNLPIVRTLLDIFGEVRRFFAGDITFFEAGKNILIALGEGIWSAVTYPFEMLKRALGWLRSLLPFSDAETGPLSDLTASGAAILKTLARGMLSVLGLPGRILGLVFGGLQNTAARAWQRLESLGASVVGALAAPFSGIADAASAAWRRIADTAAGAWSVLRTGFTEIGGFLRSAAASLVDVFRELPLASTLTEVFSSVRGFLAGDTTFFEAGRNILTTLGEGITSAATVPVDLLKKSLGKVRSLLPFSDAETGPLSNLTASGMAIPTTLAQGMTRMLALPGTVVGQAVQRVLTAIRGGWGQIRSLGAAAAESLTAPFQGVVQAATLPGQAVAGALTSMNQGLRRIVAPAALNGTLALTPVIAGQVPLPAGPPLRLGPTVSSPGPARSPEASRLLAETRGSLASAAGASSESPGESVRLLLDALLGKLDALADRPIDVSVTTLLDGREVAQSVYRDIRERKIRNYETL